MNIIKYIETLFKKENTVKNVSNFTPYGTDPKKDKMVKSNYWRNRLKIAYRGYGLDVLINDEDWEVRKVVGEQGYGLGILVNDENRRVREAVLHYLKENNLTLAEWCNQNNKEINLRKLTFSPYPEVRAEAVKSGYIYKKDEIYIDLNCKFIPYGTNYKKDKMVKSDDLWDHLKMAEEGYALDVLVNDKDWEVRRVVAKQGYGLGILANDEDYGVRAAVAKQGYGLDVLIYDKDSYVREAVRNYLISHNLTLEQWKSNQDPSELSVSTSKAEEFNPLDINTLKSEMQNLKDQINTLTKENKSLQEALENHISLEKKMMEGSYKNQKKI